MKLPHALYFLSEGSFETEYGARPEQIWRLDPDGVTLIEITHEVDGVADFDISLATDRLAYVIDQYVGNQHGGSQLVRNQLVMMRTDGTERQVIVNESLVDDKGMNQAGSPRWSPGGETLAFHQGGLVFYKVPTRQIVKVVVDDVDKYERYSPELWSPDGKRLLVKQGGYEGGWWMLYDLQTETLIRLNGPYGSRESATWSSDSRWAVFTSAYLMGGDCKDLLQFNASTQMDSVLIPCEITQEKYSNLGWPVLTPSTDLVYFYCEANSDGSEYASAPWRIMRTAFGREKSLILLRSDIPVNVCEVLWAEDGTIAIVSFDDSSVALVPTDKSQSLQFVAGDGKNLRWGP
jgi:Tol biopolymer transport system component